MEQIEEVVIENLINLRRKNGMTQIDLAKRVNYSDKAISRWENGEVIPDIKTLKVLSEVYNVPISYLFEKHRDIEDKNKSQFNRLNKILITLISLCVVWTMAIIAYLYVDRFSNGNFWQAFIWAVPVSCVVIRIFAKKWNASKIVFLVCFTFFIWSLITSFYLQFLDLNLWQLYILCIPLQLARIAMFFMEK